LERKHIKKLLSLFNSRPITFRTKNINYGVSRLIYTLMQMDIDASEIGAYDFSRQDNLSSDLCDEIPPSDIYGFSLLDKNYEAGLLLAERLKDKHPNSKILFGGTTATELKDEILAAFEFVDYVCTGMGDDTIRGLMLGETYNVPNLTWKEGKKIIKNGIIYPPRDWEFIFPASFKWNIQTFDFNTAYVLGGLGCIGRCNYCSIREKEPIYTKRSLQATIEEIRLQRSWTKKNIELHLIDEMPLINLEQLLLKMKEEGLDKTVSNLMFDFRPDFVPVEYEKIKKIIEQNPLINFILFSGFESFSDNTLQELEKGITAEQNMQALEILKELKSKYSNFNFMPSFITLTPNTRKEDLRRQIWIIKDHFLDLDLHYERFMNILLIRTKNAKKYGLLRKRGHLLEDNSQNRSVNGYLGIPRDREILAILNKFALERDRLPSFEERAKKGINNKKLKYAEIFLLDRILNDQETESIILETNQRYRS